jgi:5,10-methylenetetrahydromethanopterin reductase
MTLTVSAQFSATRKTPEHIALAEDLGYARAWVFDTPHQSPDVWMTLTQAAALTSRIGLGPGVLVPILRHPMVNAAAAATLAGLAPGRVAVAFGTGFAGARALGVKSASWDYMRDYVTAFRALIAGTEAHWAGTTLQMTNPVAGSAGTDVPVLISAIGPKGLAVAADLADGLFSVNGQTAHASEYRWAALAVHGTVLVDGEALDSVRVRGAAGPGNALAYHATYEHGGDVTALPGGQAWLDVITAVPEARRHLAVHDKHLTALNAADDAAWAAGAWQAIPATTVTGTAEQVAQRLAEVAGRGITEVIYQPVGPDIPRELETFLTAAHTIGAAPHHDPAQGDSPRAG